MCSPLVGEMWFPETTLDFLLTKICDSVRDFFGIICLVDSDILRSIYDVELQGKDVFIFIFYCTPVYLFFRKESFSRLYCILLRAAVYIDLILLMLKQGELNCVLSHHET